MDISIPRNGTEFYMQIHRGQIAITPMAGVRKKILRAYSQRSEDGTVQEALSLFWLQFIGKFKT